MLYGYARCSSAEQSLDIQIEALEDTGYRIGESLKVSAARKSRTDSGQ